MKLDVIGKNIKRLREKNKITQNELAQKLFVSFQAVSAWERGQAYPDLENIIKIAELFKVKIDTIINNTDSSLFVAIDGGGTKTEFVLFDKSGYIKKRILCTGANPNAIGIDKSISVLEDGLGRLFDEYSAKAVFAGIAGVSTGDYIKVISNMLSKKYSIPVNVNTDGINVLAMGKNPENTASVICGTGSCIFIRKNYVLKRLGGWGNLFAPAGSAYKVGSDAICHTLAVNDGLETPTVLSKLVEEKLDGNIWQNLSSIYEKGVAYIASFAPLVTQAVDMGDKKALEILKQNAKELSILIKFAREHFGAPDEFVCSGGFIKNSIFKDILEEESGVSLYIPSSPPIYGACLECLRLNGEKPDNDFINNFTESYR